MLPRICGYNECDNVLVGKPKKQRYCCPEHRPSRKRYGLTKDQYQAILDRNTCAACGEAYGSNRRRIHIDHCHDGGHFRGVLHDKCNIGIGMSGDDPNKLLLWAAYLYRDIFDLRDLCLR